MNSQSEEAAAQCAEQVDSHETPAAKQRFSDCPELEETESVEQQVEHDVDEGRRQEAPPFAAPQ